MNPKSNNGNFTRVQGSRTRKPNPGASAKPNTTKTPNPNYKPPASVKKP